MTGDTVGDREYRGRLGLQVVTGDTLGDKGYRGDR